MKLTTKRLTRSKWSSEKGFVFATAAAAVGLGNIWRFPYMTGENGGAAFIIAYILAVIILGLPLMLLEVSAGKVEKGGVVKTFRGLNKRAAWFGWLVIGLTFIILSYYLVLTGWTLGFAIDSLDGQVSSFEEFTSGTKPLLYFGIVTVLVALVVLKGVRLIELASRLLMPLLLAVVLGLAIYGLTLQGAGEALQFLFAPDFSAFASPTLWALAFGQAFYSLAIGQGYLLTYGSFLPKKTRLPRAISWVAGIETGIALIAGLMIFPLVFTYGLNPSQGTDLAFTTLPIAFANIGVGAVLAIIFFWLFFLAAISSSIASMQVIKTAVEEETRLTSFWATIAVFLALLPLGVLSALSFTPLEVSVAGQPVLDILDKITANQLVIISGLLGGAIISWSIPRRKFINLFGDRYRAMAHGVVSIGRYLWVGVVAVLVISMLSS